MRCFPICPTSGFYLIPVHPSDPKDYLLWHMYTGPSLMKDLVEIEKKYDVETNHEPMIVSPVSGAHNGPWLAGYGLLFLRRADEPLDAE